MNRIIIAVYILTIWSCANRVPPTGGPKDEEPPLLITSIPLNGSTNVKSNEITLMFNELVVTKNIKKELLITPRIDFEYEIKIKKNTIILSLEEQLDSATTYTFNFGNSVVDITEGNPALDLIIAFSTGPMLDTLTLTGNSNDLFTQKLVEGLLVGLYKSGDTLDLFNSPPFYLASTDKLGDYTFRNVKSDSYKLVAFNDKNKNLMCESDKEAYAFLDQPIKIDSNFIADTLKLQSLNIDSLQLKRTRKSGQYFIVVANKYLTQVELTTANDSLISYSLNEDRKEIKIYNTFKIKDSLLVEISMYDSINNAFKDTFYLSFAESDRKYDEYKIEVKNLEVYPEKRKLQYKVLMSKPSKLIYLDSITIQADSLTIINFDSTWNIINNDTYTEFTLNNYLPRAYLDSIGSATSETQNVSSKAPIKAKEDKVSQQSKVSAKVFNLVLAKGTFQSVEKDTSEVISLKIEPKYNKSFGVLKGNITTDYTHYTIQLLDETYKIIDEKSPAVSYKFSQVAAGDYIIRIMIDSNKNNKWDAGNILLNQLPEPVIIYKDQDGKSLSTIRANWEVTLDLKF